MASEERRIQGIGQPRTITSTSTTRANLANMSIDDTEQLNMELLTQLSVDNTIQSSTQSTEKYSGQVDPITVTSMVQRATGYGLTSGFSGPVFGQTATPIQHSSFASGKIANFESLASNALLFGNLAQSGRTALYNGPSFTILPSETSNMSNGTFECEIRSDADQRKPSAKASNKTIPRLLADESAFVAPSGFRRNVFGQIASSKMNSSSRSEDANTRRSNENIRQNVLAPQKFFSDATSHDNAIVKASTITPASSNQGLSTSMSIDDADQLTNNTAASESFNATILSSLSVDENFQTPKQREDHGSRQVDLTTFQRATGLGSEFRLTSGFSDPVFGQTSTTSQHSSVASGRIANFESLASNAPSFGNLAQSGRTVLGNRPSFTILPSETSNKSNGTFECEIRSDAYQRERSAKASNKTIPTLLADDGNSQNLKQPWDEIHGQEISTTTSTITHGTSVFESTFGAPFGSRSEGANTKRSNVNIRQNVLAPQKFFSDATSHDNAIGKANTITPASSNQQLSTCMSIDDADQLTNNTAASESFNATILSHLTVDENSQTPKRREDHGSRQRDLTTSQRATGLASEFRLNSGFSNPVFGQTSTPSQHSSFTSGSSPNFDNLASNTQSFADLAKSGGTAFGIFTSFAALLFETSNQPMRVFESELRSADAPNKTVSSNLTNDGNYHNKQQSGEERQRQEISTNITTFTKGTTNFKSTFGTPEFCRPVVKPSAASKTDSSSKSEGADGIPKKESVRQNVFATQQIINDVTSHALFGNQGDKCFRSNGFSQTASFPGGKFSSESIGGVRSLGFTISQHQEQSTSEEYISADGSYGQVDPTTNTITTQRVNSVTSGFTQPKFGKAATPHQHASSYSNNRFESPVQASDLRSFGDLAQSSGSTLSSASTFASSTLLPSEFENPSDLVMYANHEFKEPQSGSEGSTFGSGLSFTGYRS